MATAKPAKKAAKKPAKVVAKKAAKAPAKKAAAAKTAPAKTGSTASLPAEYFGIEPNVSVMHQVVTAQLAHRRSGTQNSKTRSEVRGGGTKPFSQRAPVTHVRVHRAHRTWSAVELRYGQSHASTHSAHLKR